jgi:hypothetical protein
MRWQSRWPPLPPDRTPSRAGFEAPQWLALRGPTAGLQLVRTGYWRTHAKWIHSPAMMSGRLPNDGALFLYRRTLSTTRKDTSMKLFASSLILATTLSVSSACVLAAQDYGLSVRMFGWPNSTEGYAFAYPGFSFTNLSSPGVTITSLSMDDGSANGLWDVVSDESASGRRGLHPDPGRLHQQPRLEFQHRLRLHRFRRRQVHAVLC